MFINLLKKKQLVSNWLNEDDSCTEHKLFILENLFICKIFKKTKDYSISSTQSKLTKLKIPSHT